MHPYQLRSICVFCSSSAAVDDAYSLVAEETGAAIARGGYTLVYGGTASGSMGRLAESAREHGGRIVGVIPESLRALGIVSPHLNEAIFTVDMRERKSVMEERSDAFIALPGGLGTLEEVLEILTLKQLGFHRKPVVFLNTAGFYDPLLSFFAELTERRFVKSNDPPIFHCADSITGALAYLRSYRPSPVTLKWFDENLDPERARAIPSIPSEEQGA